MNKVFQLSLYLFFCNALSFFFFTDSALSQKRELEVQDCYITVDKSELTVFSPRDNGCTYQHTFSDGSTKYQLNFDVGDKKRNSRVEIINNGNKQIVPINNFIGAGTAIQIDFLNFFNPVQSSLLFRYGTYGSGFNPCHIIEMILFDPNIPTGYIKPKTKNLGVSRLEPENPNYINSCIDFQDIDNDKVLEIIAIDGRFGYQFGSDGGSSSAPVKVLKFTTNDLVDVTKKYPNFIKKQAQEAWDRVLSESLSNKYDGLYGQNLESGGYFLAMATYLALKSLLGEYKQGMSLVNKRLEIAQAQYTPEGQRFPYDVEEFLIERDYIKKSDGLMVYLPQNNKLTCQQAIDSVKAELVKRKYFVSNYKNEISPEYGLIQPKLVIENNLIKQEYYDYSKNRIKTVTFVLSGEFLKLTNFLNSPKLLESLTAKILGSCQDFGLVEYVHWFEGYVPVGYFPDGSVRTFININNMPSDYISKYTRENNDDNDRLKYQWGYYSSNF